MSESEIRHLLYEDESGDVVGLDEVQLLDPPPESRIEPLRRLLSSDDSYLVFQAAIVLAAWGDDAGLDKVEELVDSQIHTSGEFSPHRIDDYDNVYDDLAYAVHLYGLTEKREEDRARIYSKMLRLYGPCVFQSQLKYALLRCNFTTLTRDVFDAIRRSQELDRPYLASQLLPVLANWSPKDGWDLIPQFIGLAQQTPNPLTNVAEALRYIKTPESEQLLKRLAGDADYIVAEQAAESLSLMSN
jgi:hypothetical protein